MIAQEPQLRSEIEQFAAEYESLSRAFDALLTGLTAKDWTRTHGKRWTFADLPYHLAYFDRECIRMADPRVVVSPDERWLMNSEAEVDAWNARMFARRPAGQSVESSLAQWRASRQLVHDTLQAMTDADLAERAWNPFFGWTSRREALTGIVAHSFNHLVEARLRLGVSASDPMPAVTHRSLGFYLALLERMVDRERVASTTFTAVMNFTGSGGGAWTIAVKDGVCRVTEGAADRPNLALTQSPDAFVASFTKVKNPMVLMLTGKIKVKGFGALGTFGKLFPPPSADPRRTWPVTTEPAAA